MKINKITIIGFRGLREFEYDFDIDKIFIKYGFNGTGKSSLYQGIYFGITGKFKPVSSFYSTPSPIIYRHKALDDADLASVRISFTHNADASYWIERTIDNSGAINVTDSGKNEESILQNSTSEHCFLNKNMFSEMVDSAERDSWEKLSPLLGHEKLANFRDGLKALANSITRDLGISEIEATLKQLDIEMRRVHELYETSLKKLGLVKCSYSVIKNELIGLGCDEQNIDIENMDWAKLLKQFPGTEKLKEISNKLGILENEIIQINLVNLYEKEFSEILEFLHNFHKCPEKIQEKVLAEFYAVAHEVVKGLTDGSCPLCNLKPDDWKVIRANLAEKKQISGEIQEDFVHYQQEVHKIKVSVNTNLERLKTWTEQNEHNKATDELIKKLNVYRDSIEVAHERLLLKVIKGVTQEEKASFMKSHSEAENGLKEAKELLEKSKKGLIASRDALSKNPALEKFYDLEKIYGIQSSLGTIIRDKASNELKLEIAKDITDRIKKFSSIVDDSETDLNTKILEEIEINVKDIFHKITNQNHLSPKFKIERIRSIKQAQILIEDFHGLGEVLVRDYLSESYKNALGLSIYFASLINHQPTLKTFVLDDITHSSDIELRRGLARYLKSDLKNHFHLFIFTHDDNWADKIRGLFQNEYKELRAFDWTISGATYKSEKWQTLMEGAREKINRGDKFGGNQLRMSLELFMDDLCEHLGIMMPYRAPTKDRKFETKKNYLVNTINDVWASGVGVIDSSSPAILTLNSSQKIANLASHAGSFDSWSIADLSDTMQDIEDLMNLFKCKTPITSGTCNSLLNSLEQNAGNNPICKKCNRSFQT